MAKNNSYVDNLTVKVDNCPSLNDRLLVEIIILQFSSSF